MPTTTLPSFIEPGELEQLLDEVEVKMQGVLDSLVIDTDGDHNTGNTARRVAKMYLNEVFKGRYVAGAHHHRVSQCRAPQRADDRRARSPCAAPVSHHFCPVIGKIWIGVMPNEHTNVIGLSKYARLAEWVMGRPQIQEEAVVQLADLIMEKTQPDGLAIVMEASHYCMAWRGVKDMDSKMINSVMRGVFLKDSDPAPRVSGAHSKKEINPCWSVCFMPAARWTPAPMPSKRILAQSRQHNPTCGITGILCYGGGIFLQAIEGGRMAVSELYGHIQRDPRHKDVVLLHYEEISERRFGGWTMGQVNLLKLNHSILLKYSEKAELDPYAASGKVSLALLEELMATASIIGRA